MGLKTCEFIEACFSSMLIPLEINNTLVALIHKNNDPETIKMFCPVSLYNVIYKSITKILVTKLWPFLDKLINFILGWSTNDNIVMTQEILHTLQSKKSKKEGMIFKIDLKKAYNKISLSFLKDTLHYFNFNDSWIDLIMSCVSQVRTSILWNGEPRWEPRIGWL